MESEMKDFFHDLYLHFPMSLRPCSSTFLKSPISHSPAVPVLFLVYASPLYIRTQVTHEYGLVQNLQIISKYMDHTGSSSPTPFFLTS